MNFDSEVAKPLGALEARVHCYDPMNAQLLGLAFDWTVSGVVYVPILETTAHQLCPGADMGAYIGAVLACDVGAVVVKLMVLPRHPALVAVAAVVCLPDTGSRDLLHPSDKGTGTWLTWPNSHLHLY